MIDPHVHCRDWGESHKETLKHALGVAYKTGVAGVFDMPNTRPPITTRELVMRRLADAKAVGSPVFYGLYVGATPDPAQLKEAVDCYEEFTNVIGIKMYAGESVGNLAITEEEAQRRVYGTLATLGYEGVLAVHCEKEASMNKNLWTPSNPGSHSLARPAVAEHDSVMDQIIFAQEARYKGRLHFLHVSTPESVDLIQQAKRETKLRLSCGVTPHHCLLSVEDQMFSEQPLLYKVNPPLRDRETAERMLAYLKAGKIDFIETDHAPHTLDEKTGKTVGKDGNPVYMSGIVGLPFLPHFKQYLLDTGLSVEDVEELTHWNACDIFNIDISPLHDSETHLDLHTEYPTDVYSNFRESRR